MHIGKCMEEMLFLVDASFFWSIFGSQRKAKQNAEIKEKTPKNVPRTTMTKTEKMQSDQATKQRDAHQKMSYSFLMCV